MYSTEGLYVDTSKLTKSFNLRRVLLEHSMNAQLLQTRQESIQELIDTCSKTPDESQIGCLSKLENLKSKFSDLSFNLKDKIVGVDQKFSAATVECASLNFSESEVALCVGKAKQEMVIQLVQAQFDLEKQIKALKK